MKKHLKKELPVLLLCAFASNHLLADVIGFDMLNGESGQTQGLNYFTNDAELGFDSPQDAFGKYTKSGLTNFVPDVLIDASGEGLLDNFGFIFPNEGYTFFGVSDTKNNSNPAGVSNAEWGFDVSGYESLSVDMDFAAMGDFEASDTYNITYALDDNEFQSLFLFEVESSQALNYTMVNGNQRFLNDPLSIRSNNSPFSFNLNNVFAEYTSQINGIGNTLKLRLTATADGGTEGFGFSNIRINGQSIVPDDFELIGNPPGEGGLPDLGEPLPEPIASVNEPSTFILMAVTLIGLASRARV